MPERRFAGGSTPLASVSRFTIFFIVLNANAAVCEARTIAEWRTANVLARIAFSRSNYHEVPCDHSEGRVTYRRDERQSHNAVSIYRFGVALIPVPIIPVLSWISTRSIVTKIHSTPNNTPPSRFIAQTRRWSMPRNNWRNKVRSALLLDTMLPNDRWVPVSRGRRDRTMRYRLSNNTPSSCVASIPEQRI